MATETENLKYPNYDELMGFVREVFVELQRPGSELKKMTAYKTVGSPAPNAFQQAMIEVRQQDGGFGLSGMSAKDFFNNDLTMRQQWADHIAAIYEAYKSALAEATDESTKVDPIAEELKAMKAQLAQMQEAMAKKDDPAETDKPVGEEESAEEDAAEPANAEDTEAEKDKKKGE